MRSGSIIAVALSGLLLGCSRADPAPASPASEAPVLSPPASDPLPNPEADGRAEARRDLAGGTARVLTYGLIRDRTQIDPSTGLPLVPIAGCFVDDRIIARARGYNGEVRDWIARFGPPPNSMTSVLMDTATAWAESERGILLKRESEFKTASGACVRLSRAGILTAYATGQSSPGFECRTFGSTRIRWIGDDRMLVLISTTDGSYRSVEHVDLRSKLLLQAFEKRTTKTKTPRVASVR